MEFLDKEMTVKPSDFPLRLRRLIKITKAILDRPDLLLIDQKALDLVQMDFPTTFKRLTKMLPSSAVLMIMSTYEDLLVTQRVIILQDGEVVEMGYIDKLIMDRWSKLSQIIIESDRKDYEALYKDVGGEERDQKLEFEAELRRLQDVFCEANTNLKSVECNEYSSKNLQYKVFSQLRETKAPTAFNIKTTQLSAISEQDEIKVRPLFFSQL